jgi:coproporphyrinogen III oxidase-like Fe-S oxidoreductase
MVVDNPADRSTWAFPAMMPYRIYHYPVPAMLGKVEAPRADRWPWPMTEGARRFGEQTPGLCQETHIYVHVPFCPFRCSFCPFYKQIDTSQIDTYVDAVVREIGMYGRLPEATRDSYSTVYFGGGTPTELSPDQLGRIIRALRDNLRLSDDVEITLEGVCEEMLRDDYLARVREMGVTRVAFGVQSLDKAVRQAIGRGPESVEAYPQVIDAAKELGMYANVEMMLGCPEQDEDVVLRDFQEVVSWEPSSVDVASYQMVPGTNLFKTIVRGQRTEPAVGARLLAMRQVATQFFREHGYRPGSCEVFVREDTHRYSPSTTSGVENGLNSYLAFGPSAIGHLAATAYTNIPELAPYLAALDDGRLPIARRTRMGYQGSARRAMLGGLGGLFVPDSFLVNDRYRRRIARWREQGLVERVEGGHKLTDRGIHWGSQMQVAFLTTADKAKLAPMLGSVQDQNALFSSQTVVGAELLEQIGEGSAVRKTAYRTALRVLNHLPGIDKRGTNLLGTKESAVTER